MVDDTPLIAEKSRKKQGHRVLCCCDSRKAAVLVSLVALVFSILALVGAAIPSTDVPVNTWSIVTFSLSILFYMLVIWGAIRYHRCAVFTSLLWDATSFVILIIGMVTYNWDSLKEDERIQSIAAMSIILVWRLLTIYANSTFLYEVGKGIMSPENHSRERYSCCCNV